MNEDDWDIPDLPESDEPIVTNQDFAIKYYQNFDSELWLTVVTPVERKKLQVYLASNDAAIIVIDNVITAWVPKEVFIECIDHIVKRFLTWRAE